MEPIISLESYYFVIELPSFLSNPLYLALTLTILTLIQM